MTRDEMLRRFRIAIDDTKYPYDLDDTDALILLADGEDWMCEETGFFLDKTNYTLTSAVGVQSYTFDSRIIEILDIFDGERRLHNFQESDRPASGEVEFSVSPSDLCNWQADRETGVITFLESPAEIKTYQLHVWRYPRVRLDEDGGQPALPVNIQQGAIEWAAAYRFGTADTEVEDKKKAAEHLAKANMYAARGKVMFHRMHKTRIYIAPAGIYAT